RREREREALNVFEGRWRLDLDPRPHEEADFSALDHQERRLFEPRRPRRDRSVLRMSLTARRACRRGRCERIHGVSLFERLAHVPALLQLDLHDHRASNVRSPACEASGSGPQTVDEVLATDQPNDGSAWASTSAQRSWVY